VCPLCRAAPDLLATAGTRTESLIDEAMQQPRPCCGKSYNWHIDLICDREASA
jgi:hypothetical protein